MSIRSVRKKHSSVRDDIGDLETRRPLPNDLLQQIDPFLFLNHHGPQIYPPGNRGLPFGPHPHRGFETVTFILDGSLAHRDTGGHESVIDKGGVQWMTAGRGLEHEELSPREFLERGGPLEILQLWVNLPRRLKMTEPRYTGLQKDEIPFVEMDDGRARVNVISGEFRGRRGPIESITDVHMTTIELAAGGRVVLPAPRERNVFLYVARGKVNVAEKPVDEYHLVEMSDDGDEVEIEGVSDAVVLFGHAVPYREPVVSYGPFVMNTQGEIRQAMLDYQAGKFRSAAAKPQP